MTKTHLPFKLGTTVSLALILSSCGAKAPTDASQTSLAALPAATQLDMSAAIELQSDCTDKITARMIDPAAANVSFTPLSDENGLQAQVKLLNRESGGTIELNFTCVRTANGEVVTTLVSD